MRHGLAETVPEYLPVHPIGSQVFIFGIYDATVMGHSEPRGTMGALRYVLRMEDGTVVHVDEEMITIESR